MLTIFVIAVFHALCAAGSAFTHAISHAIGWLMFPDVARYGACMDCGDERASKAYARKHGR